MFEDIFALSNLVKIDKLTSVSCKKVIQFSNKAVDGWDKFNESFWNQDSTKIPSFTCTIGNSLADFSNDIVKGKVFSLNFLTDDANIRLALQSTLQGNMTCRTPHQFNEMPIFTCRITITLNISNKLRISFCCSIKTERRFNLGILQVTVNSLWTSNDLNAILLSCIIFSQDASVGIRVIATNNDNGLNVKLTDYLQTFLKLIFLFQFGATATDDIKTTCIAILFKKICCYFHIIMVNQSPWSHKETIEAILRIKLLNFIKQSTNNIMTTRSLTTTKNNTYIHSFLRGFFTWYELYQRHAISIRKQFLDV